MAKEKIIEIELKKLKKIFLICASLIFISWLGVWVRLSTIDTPTVLDYDPWWFYRYAQMILDNNLKPPIWDYQSFSMPGRPVSSFLGWSYTIIFFYKLLQLFIPSITLMKAAIFSPLILVALIPIPAYFLGKLLSNELGGIVTALLAVLMPSFIGVSMAGYCDSDTPVVFYFFLSVLSLLLLLKRGRFLPLRKQVIYILFAIVANLLFIWNWGGGWITLILFTVFFAILPLFRVLENFLRTFSLKINVKELIEEDVEVGRSIFLVILLTNLLGYILFGTSEFRSFFGGLAFTGLSLILRGIVLLLLFAWVGIFFYSFIKPLLGTKTSQKKKIESLVFSVGCLFLIYLIIQAFIKAPTSPLLVNISVAELQPISLSQFTSVISRNGVLPTLSPILLLVLAFYKIIKKEEIFPEEIFFFLWSFSMLLLITRGVRFSLQFGVAASVTAGYLIGNYKKYPKILLVLLILSLVILNMFLPKRIPEIISFIFLIFISFVSIFLDKKIQQVLILSIFLFHLLFFASNSIQLGLASRGMMISQNWYDMLDWFVENADKDALLMTWWDPGHILAGYTYYKGKPLRVHADGAHCGPGTCVPYNHNIRIQDMGRIFSTSDEEEALQIIKKYVNLTDEQCEEAKEAHPQMPADACKPVSEVYIIASNDLIGKYYWMSYFGTGQGRNFFQLPLTSVSGGNLVYSNGLVTVARKDDKLVPIMNLPQQGIRNAIIKEIEYYENGLRKRYSYENASNVIDGLLWIDPSYRYAIYMDPVVKNSIFSRMFFWNGEGLKHFKLVYSNPEIRVFKVIF
ncbi:MAG TPA: hypothetical protein ENF38_01790 [Candidatus Aenigmarchaeota archaeon]|nr:hypothetical protein [Candidatus Aenigmarchaeota archaeon]